MSHLASPKVNKQLFSQERPTSPKSPASGCGGRQLDVLLFTPSPGTLEGKSTIFQSQTTEKCGTLLVRSLITDVNKEFSLMSLIYGVMLEMKALVASWAIPGGCPF